MFSWCEWGISLVVKCGCHCTHTNENSDNGNQKATSEYSVSVETKITYNDFNSSFPSAIGPLSRFTKTTSKCLNCNEFCTNEGRGNTQKELWQVKQV